MMIYFFCRSYRVAVGVIVVYLCVCHCFLSFRFLLQKQYHAKRWSIMDPSHPTYPSNSYQPTPSSLSSPFIHKFNSFLRETLMMSILTNPICITGVTHVPQLLHYICNILIYLPFDPRYYHLSNGVNPVGIHFHIYYYHYHHQ